MSWSYSGDPAKSALDETRFLLGDTDQCDQLLQDGEILWVLSKYNNVPINAAIRCCEAVISKFSRLAQESVGQVSISFQQKREGYAATRKMLVSRLMTEDALPYAGGISKTDVKTVDANQDRIKPDFTKHMMENPQVGPGVSSINGILGRPNGVDGE